MREDLNARAERRMAVLEPLKLVIDNYPDDREERCAVQNHPQKPELGTREVPFARELWIEREDYAEEPPKGYFRLAPGAEVRLRYAYVVKCTSVEKDSAGKVVAVHCEYDPDTRSGTPGAEKKKVKGNIHWVSARTRSGARCGSTIASSSPRIRVRAIATSAPTSTRIPEKSSPGSSSRAWPARDPRIDTSSSVTATSWRIASTADRVRRCSIAR